jgi:GNAT superfamily N-acetyltransferase
MTLTIRVMRGTEVEGLLDDLAALRMQVFRDWPYLYDGDATYERNYLAGYRDNPRAVLVGAFDGRRIVGASTGTPMEDHAAEFGATFADRDLSTIFYCAESVLLPEYRGQGAGRAFFDHREAHARDIGRSYSTFSAVVRPDNHPARPERYHALDPFWRARGYAPIPGAVAHFRWKDIGESRQTAKPMQFWGKHL